MVCCGVPLLRAAPLPPHYHFMHSLMHIHIPLSFLHHHFMHSLTGMRICLAVVALRGLLWCASAVRCTTATTSSFHLHSCLCCMHPCFCCMHSCLCCTLHHCPHIIISFAFVLHAFVPLLHTAPLPPHHHFICIRASCMHLCLCCTLLLTPHLSPIIISCIHSCTYIFHKKFWVRIINDHRCFVLFLDRSLKICIHSPAWAYAWPW